MTLRLLAAGDPPPVLASRRDGRSAFVIAVDHAGQFIPKRLATLGLGPSDLERHIAWDIGALAAAESVSATLDAPLIAQNYSRLVIDCNRRTDDRTSIPTISESTEIPGNMNLDIEQVNARRREISEPYHQHLSALLDERAAAGRRTILVAQHSMTNVFKGVHRKMHAAVIYNRDTRFAACLLDALRSDAALIVGDNEPYTGKEGGGYTLWHHAEPRGIPHVEIEIRQDLIQLPFGQAEWSRRIAAALLGAEDAFLRKFS